MDAEYEEEFEERPPLHVFPIDDPSHGSFSSITRWEVKGGEVLTVKWQIEGLTPERLDAAFLPHQNQIARIYGNAVADVLAEVGLRPKRHP